MTLAARIRIERNTIKLTPATSDFDMRLTLNPTMAFIESSNGAVLEIRAPTWRCVLSEQINV